MKLESILGLKPPAIANAILALDWRNHNLDSIQLNETEVGSFGECLDHIASHYSEDLRASEDWGKDRQLRRFDYIKFDEYATRLVEALRKVEEERPLKTTEKNALSSHEIIIHGLEKDWYETIYSLYVENQNIERLMQEAQQRAKGHPCDTHAQELAVARKNAVAQNNDTILDLSSARKRLELHLDPMFKSLCKALALPVARKDWHSR